MKLFADGTVSEAQLVQIFFDRVENIVGKGENDVHQHFLFLNNVSLTLYHTILTFIDLEKKKPFENIKGKGENAGNQHFLLFLQCFLTIPKRILFLSYIYFVVCKCFQFVPV